MTTICECGAPGARLGVFGCDGIVRVVSLCPECAQIPDDCQVTYLTIMDILRLLKALSRDPALLG